MATAPTRRRVAWAALLIVLCTTIRSTVAGPLMAVDYGGESIRVSLVKPGRSPISVVLNEASKRKSAAQVAFVDDDRLLGDDAALLSVRYPDRVYSRVRDLLGKRADDQSLQALLQNSRFPYKLKPYSEQRPTAAIETHTGKLYSAEELVASILQYARSISEAAADGAAVRDCVITVPAFWGQTQRQALIDAARVSGINVLALINSHAAAALQYGIERDFTNKTERIILYDMGATSTECALVEFSSFRVKEVGIWKTYGQFEVKDVAWDASLGSETLDMLLFEYFADEFAAKHPGLDPRTSPKAVAKLRKQVKRTKEMLSANSFAPVSVEELIEGIDFRSKIERSEFEKLAGSFLERASKPLEEIIERNKVSIAELTAVELLGGGSRVPAVKAALSKALGGRALDMHLDADEAVVLGAGLFAANLSTTFRLRKFGMMDGITYPVTFQLEQPDSLELEPSLEAHFKPKALLPRMKRLPARRNVPLPSIPSADVLRAKLYYNTSAGGGLPPGTPSDLIATFDISGFVDVSAKYNETGKLSLHVRADESGIISLEKAEAAVEITEEYTVKVPEKESTTTADEPEVIDSAPIPQEVESAKNETAEDVEMLGNETAAALAPLPPLPKLVDEVRTRKRTVRVPLKVAGPGFESSSLPPEILKASKKVLEGLAKAEKAKREASRQKNELEAYVIGFRGRLQSDDDVIAVTLEKERAAFLEKLDEAEEWLYSEGEQEPAASFIAKILELKKTGSPIELRAKELKALPRAKAAAEDFVRISKQAISGWGSTKPWLNATEVENVKAEVDKLESWLKEESGKQKSRKPHEAPSLTSAEIEAAVDAVRKPLNRLKSTKKPKPPPVPKAEKNSTAEEKNATTEEAAEKPQEEEEPPTAKSERFGIKGQKLQDLNLPWRVSPKARVRDVKEIQSRIFSCQNEAFNHIMMKSVLRTYLSTETRLYRQRSNRTSNLDSKRAGLKRSCWLSGIGIEMV